MAEERRLINWDEDPKLEGIGVELLRMGSLSGKNNTIKDSSDLVVDLQLVKLVLTSVRDGKWVEQTMRLNYRNKTHFKYPGKQTLPEDLLSGEKTVQGFLMIFQEKRSDIDDLDNFIAFCDAKREIEEQEDCEDVSEDKISLEFPGYEKEFKKDMLTKYCAFPEAVENPAEHLDHEDSILENKQVIIQREEDMRNRTPEPARTPEPESEDDAVGCIFSQGSCAFSDEEENTCMMVEESCLKEPQLGRLMKKTDGTKKHSLIERIERDEAGEGVFIQGSCAFSDDEDEEGDIERKTFETTGSQLYFRPDKIGGDFGPGYFFLNHKPF